MAYVSQEEKKALSPKIKEICKRYGVKASIAINNHSTLVLNVKSSSIDFFDSYNRIAGERFTHRNGVFDDVKDYMDVNTSWYKEHFDGIALEFLKEIIPAMKGPDWFDKSDIMTDYFHVKHYVDINLGKWDKPYILEK